MGAITESHFRHFPYLPERLNRIGDLAYNLWFSWHSQPVWLFKNLDTKLWDDVYHNPVRLLHEIDNSRLEKVATQQSFLNVYDSIVSFFDNYMTKKDTWYAQNYPNLLDKKIAYFSMEFGVHECLPIYSGGLGILAGDHLKTASDMGIPIVGVGLLYRESYFTQNISRHGHQQTLYLRNDFSTMALTPAMDSDGKVLTVRIKCDHREIAAKVWKAEVGRVTLYLLDTDFPENPPEDREITERLYVDNRDRRLMQEVLLGIGGVTALKALGINPNIYHMNEGHSGFLAIELIRRKLAENKSLEEAVQETKSSVVFTTHTPVPAGNEVFEAARIDSFLTKFWECMGLTREQFYSFARVKNTNDYNAFNMTVLALQLSRYANAVSKLHGEVSRQMWHSVWPEKGIEEVPILAITNGVHTRTWMASHMKNLLDRYLVEDWRYQLSSKEVWQGILDIPNKEFWDVRCELRKLLIDSVRRRLVVQRERNGESRDAIQEAKNILDPNVLTIGFARRFAPYKRATLLFRNREWLKFLISRAGLPVQIIFAGKAHPADQQGQSLIQQVYGESRNPDFVGKIVFVENYDMSFARRLVAGVDVWLNTPRRPKEASGTSGMKVAINGALNLSICDGWWHEAYNGKNGWAIGEDRIYYDEFEQDEADSKSLYHLLENEVVHKFYELDEDGLPSKWLEMVKESMGTLIPEFSSQRMLEEYARNMYKPVFDG